LLESSPAVPNIVIVKMGLFSIFRKKRKKQRKRSSNTSKKTIPYINKIKGQIENIVNQISTINIALKKHNDQLLEHTQVIKNNANGLKKLEHILEYVPTNPSAQTYKLNIQTPEKTTRFSPDQSIPPKPAQKFDIDQFSEQEKRILAVFFQNKSSRLSYLDLAKMLNKSAHTVKNQMNQIRQKADLFERTIGRQSRNLFKLKNDLKIEKYLNIGQPIEQPISTGPVGTTD